MTDPYEGLNATARRREQDEDLGAEEYERIAESIRQEWAAMCVEDGFDPAKLELDPKYVHAEVVARMKAAKDAAQD